jgi:hypothetical protein
MQILTIVVELFLLALPTLLLRALAPVAFRSFGAKRLVYGYLAVALAVLVASFAMAFVDSQDLLASGVIQQDAMVGKVAGTTLLMFIYLFIGAALFTGVVVAPAIVVLEPRWVVSVVAVAGAGLIVGTLVSVALTFFFPSNEWARTHPFDALLHAGSSIGVAIFAVALAFGIGARLPFRARPAVNAA